MLDPVNKTLNVKTLLLPSYLETRYSSRAKETVVFPAPLRPVNQMVQPRNRLPMTSPRFDRETACFCAYTFVAIVVLWKGRRA